MSAIIDAETMAALKVLRGDHKKDPNAIDKDFADGLTKQIVDALSSQKDSSSSQTAELIAAVKEQTAVLQKLTGLLETKQKAVVVVKENAAAASSVDSTAVETAVSTITEDPAVAAAVAAAEEPTTPEPPPPAAAPKSTPVPAPVAAPVVAVRGPWGFVESADATKRRSRVEKTGGKFRYLEKGEAVPEEAFKPITKANQLNLEDSLFGKVSGSNLIGDSFGERWTRMKDRVDQYGKLQAPKWSDKSKESVRAYLPRVTIGGKTEIKLSSGIYYLTMKFENLSDAPVEAAVIIGEIAFDNNGSVMASGAKWKKILKGETQKEPRVPPSKPKWYTSPVSEGWKNGDILRFKIDTDTNTVVYTISAPGSSEAKAGWKFDNVLTFTNTPTYKKDLRVFAYCGGKGNSSSSAKLSIVDETPTDSVSTITEGESKDESEAAPEAAPETPVAEPEAETAAASEE